MGKNYIVVRTSAVKSVQKCVILHGIHSYSHNHNYNLTQLPENSRPLVLTERVNLGGVSAAVAAGKPTGDSEDDAVAVAVDWSHWASTLRALAALLSCTADSRARPRLNDPVQQTASSTQSQSVIQHKVA